MRSRMQQPRRDWFVTSNACELQKTSTLQYSDYIELSKCCTSSEYEEDLYQIELDLPRTDESIRLFLLLQDKQEQTHEEEAVIHNTNEDELVLQHRKRTIVCVLRNILTAYCMRNPRVGYVQGHADVLCFLLGYVNNKHDEEETFWVYASVIERVFPEDFFARTPKLHGFQVDCKVYHELTVSNLVPLYPILDKIDLPLVTTLLSCKWFVSLWVGETSIPVLYEIWDAMLGEEDGTMLHLLIALHFFELAVDKIQLYMEIEQQWDSSFIYKIILDECEKATKISPQTLLEQARTLYRLKDECVENMRETIRRSPLLRKAEFAVLAKQTHFNQLELTRLQGEFTCLCNQKQARCRSKLRGLRQDDIESILSREFNTWPVEIYDPVYRFLKPDGYGNVSYYSLIQFLSVASRGTLKEKAHLFFQIINRQCRGYLDQQGILQLSDLLCCLLTNWMVVNANGSQAHMLGRSEHRRSISDAAKSPLLRRHFRKKLLLLATSDGQLQITQWLEYALSDSETAEIIAREHSQRQSSRMKSRFLSFWDVTSIQPTLRRASSESGLHHHLHPPQYRLVKACEKDAAESPEHLPGVNNYVVDAAPFLEPHTENRLAGRRHITLLSNKMSKVLETSWPPAEAEIHSAFGEAHEAAYIGSPYVFWCQCTIS